MYPNDQHLLVPVAEASASGCGQVGRSGGVHFASGPGTRNDRRGGRKPRGRGRPRGAFRCSSPRAVEVYAGRCRVSGRLASETRLTGTGSCALGAFLSAVSAGISSERVSESEIVRREAACESLSRVRVRWTPRVESRWCGGQRRRSSFGPPRDSSGRLSRRDQLGWFQDCSLPIRSRAAQEWPSDGLHRVDVIHLHDLSFRPHDSSGTSPRQVVVDVIRRIEVMAS